ncbi:ATP-binding cassette domain-containing protein [Oenococcus sicerae]|uniref:ATP-binding cassette domain-containing protein n=1 Tax=Oenococcus sicerae TaxID=2203724 RepID=A0AAJ1R922_9LACO|nr:ATP-binding cassette domain-containing protein [Oenococcus sicerae]MDN6900002.1 ATP-binding cassette domain-containing protein [Oenococcus sicerae]QAS69614.1 ATP-binding cassette domain-containing protein [Oenococcus sicerae]
MAEITLKKVSYQTKNNAILENIDFVVESGSWVTLAGPSGSGKSTILKLIADLISPTSGVVEFEGRNIQTIDPIDYRRQVSYAAQSAQLFGETVKDNLDFPYLIRKKEIDSDRQAAVLNDFDLSSDFLTHSILDISGGQRQRVGLARNFIFMPKVVLLDEVTTGLDSDSKKIVRQVIEKENKKGLTVIEVTHEIDDLKEAKQIYTLSNGQITKGVLHE